MNYHDLYYTITKKIKLDKEQCHECEEEFHSYYFKNTDNKSHLYEIVITICMK